MRKYFPPSISLPLGVLNLPPLEVATPLFCGERVSFFSSDGVEVSLPKELLLLSDPLPSYASRFLINFYSLDEGFDRVQKNSGTLTFARGDVLKWCFSFIEYSSTHPFPYFITPSYIFYPKRDFSSFFEEGSEYQKWIPLLSSWEFFNEVQYAAYLLECRDLEIFVDNIAFNKMK